MISKIILIVLFAFLSTISKSQNSFSITGNFPPLAGQQVRLVGFDGFDVYTIDSTKITEQGVFTLQYSEKDYGIGYLSAQDNKPFFIILRGETIKLKGETFAFAESIEIIEGLENQLFDQYAIEHPRREQALSAWDYLEKMYMLDTLFAKHEAPKQSILKEKQRIKDEDNLFLASLSSNSYVSYYLPLRKLVSSVSIIAQYRTEEIPAAIAAFRGIDYTDERLYKSGLLADVIESHFWLIENSGRSLDSVFIEMKISIDKMLETLVSDEKKLNEISEYLFILLEKRSLFEASEYLALKLLNETSCTINNDFASQLESYRAMKKGNIAPDFTFGKDYMLPGYTSTKIPNKLSDLRSEYTVVVFGASWCPQCPEELSQIARFYPKWKAQNIEVVFVSLDENIHVFKSFAGVFPFISVCDYQKWESPIVKAYYVFATPAMYLLDDKREILLRPNSAAQMDAWVNWFLIDGKN